MKEIHLICNAHIDPIWQWDWQEGVSATLSTFRSAVNLAGKFDYIFCHNEVTVYKYVEEYAPELFEQIKELVKCGKWRIMGGWYLQPDCNMPCGESFVRQALKGKEYFTEKFGCYPTTAINFDPFGHSKGIVQIIKKCGQDSYIFMRPYANELELPSNSFIWKGFADTEIKAFRAFAYNTPLGGSAKEIERRADMQEEDVCCVLWGVGNHGGGPSYKDLSDIAEMQKNSKDSYIHSYPEKYFAAAKPTKVFDKSLRISMPGCYTSMASVKRRHVKLENELYFAEKICSAAALSGLMEYPSQKFNVVMEDLMNAEFHDILPGTSIQSGEENGIGLLSHGLLEAERLKTRAYFALSNLQEPAKEGEYPILVFNPHPYAYKDVIECEFMLADQNWSDDIYSEITIVDQDGKPMVYQIVKEESNLNLDWRKRIVFEAELKPFSLNRYSVYVKFVKKEKAAVKDSFVFDNGRKYVEIDKETGLLKSYKLNGVEYVKDAFLPISFDDNSDPWAMSAFQLEGFKTNETPFITEKTPDGPFKGLKSIQIIEDGDVYLGIEAFFVQGNTRVRVLYKIYKNNDAVDVDVTLYMCDINKMYKLKIPVQNGECVVGQTAFATEELFDDGRENVSQRFVAVKTGDKYLAVINNCNYGSSYMNGNLYISLARGVSYCAHPINDRPIIPTDRYVKKIDQGENNFSFRLIATDICNLDRLANEFNQKPFAINVFPVESNCIGQKSVEFVLSNKNITLSALKKQEKGDGFILRLHNNVNINASTEVLIDGVKGSFDFIAYEVKTVIYKDGKFTEIDHLEI